MTFFSVLNREGRVGGIFCLCQAGSDRERRSAAVKEGEGRKEEKEGRGEKGGCMCIWLQSSAAPCEPRKKRERDRTFNHEKKSKVME